MEIGTTGGLANAATLTDATVTSPTTITVTMPAHTVGTYHLWVVTPQGLATTATSSDQFTYTK